MKPHLIKIKSLWVCACRTSVGIGYTPQTAYADWMLIKGLQKTLSKTQQEITP